MARKVICTTWLVLLLPRKQNEEGGVIFYRAFFEHFLIWVHPIDDDDLNRNVGLCN